MAAKTPFCTQKRFIAVFDRRPSIIWLSELYKDGILEPKMGHSRLMPSVFDEHAPSLHRRYIAPCFL